MKLRRLFAWAGTGLFLSSGLASAQGLVLPTGGAMHSGMAGTSTAVGVDAISALFWNPAVISGLPHNEVTIGSQLLFPHLGVTSTVPAGAYGPNLGPANTLSGRTNSDSGLVPTTAIGVVYHSEMNPRLTYGLGLNTVAAGGVNYPGDPNNPILAPTGPLNQFILGPQVGAMSVLQIAPTASYQVTDSVAVGFSPIVNVSSVNIDPALFATPSQARPIDPMQFPSASHSRPFWGAGFRTGVTYQAAEHVMTGFSYTSPQWFETWEFNARDANGNGFTLRQPFSLPQIFSAGVAYDGIQCLLLAADVRYFDYSTTKLLGESIRDGGAGWDSIWAFSFGAKYQLSDRIALLGGYLYNQNPVPDDLALFNLQLPCITEHTLTCGAYTQLTESIGMSLGYAHGFENKVTGSVAQLLGTSTTLDAKYDALVFGLHIKFGGPRCRTNCCPSDSTGVIETGTMGSPVPASAPGTAKVIGS